VVVSVAPLQIFLTALAGWHSGRQQDVIGYLVEENRVLRAQLRGRRCGSRMINGAASRRVDTILDGPRYARSQRL
jgi:hypothetical protein